MAPELQSLLPRIPETCIICGASWKGGCERSGHRFPKLGVRVFYDCGASMSLIDRAKEWADHENYVEDGYCYFIRFKNCNSRNSDWAFEKEQREKENAGETSISQGT